MNDNEHNHQTIGQQSAEGLNVRRAPRAKKWWSIGKTPLLIVPLGVFTACGPIGSDDWGSDDGVGGSAVTGGGSWADDYGYGAYPSTGGMASVGGQAAGGSGSCDVIAPQRTYVCSGWAYEYEDIGAAGLRVISEVCGDQYGGVGGSAVGGAFAVGGSIGFGGDSGVSTGGADPGEPPDDGVGGWLVYDDIEEYEGVGGQPYYGVGGQAVGAGGGWISSGGTGTGPQNPGVAKWCDSDPTGTVSGGISFAVGSCQDVDVALPLLFQEPYGGDFEVTVYGAYSPCDRGYPITSAAGIGTGQVLEIPFSSAGYSFISVEVRGEAYSDFGVRLRDRPHVVPMPSE